MNVGLGAIFPGDRFAAHREAIVAADRTLTWGELYELVPAQSARWRWLEGRRIGLIFQSNISSYLQALALSQLKVDAFLMNGQLSATAAKELGRELNLSAIVSAGDYDLPIYHELTSTGSGIPSSEGSVTILTSGSTGCPKAARHTWAGLCRPVRIRSGAPAQRWLQTYRPNLYAGLQVMLQSLLSGGALLVPSDGWAPSSIAEFAAANGAEYVSATPSYWRKLLISCEPRLLRKMRLLQITLGGEVVDQTILDSLKEHFPAARLTHIYATTELGRCFAVTDGRAGFPAQFLESPSEDGVELKVVEGELFAKSANSMQCYDGGERGDQEGQIWFATGDLVEVAGDRVYFVGRQSEMINVGGSKVFPLEIEQFIRTVPGVSDVRVFGRSSSISGQLVACEIVAEGGRDIALLKSAVRTACNSRLMAVQVPRVISFVDRIQLSAAQKTLRSS